MACRLTGTVALTVALALGLSVNHAVGQSFHLPPAVAVPVPDSTTVLIITPPDSSREHFFVQGATVRVFSGTMWITGASGARHRIDLDGRSFGAVRDYIVANFEGVKVRAPFPEYDARFTDEDFPTVVEDSLMLESGLGGVDLDAAFGLLFALSDIDERQDNRLFSSGGVRLDLAAQHRLNRRIFLRFRLGFSSSEPVEAATTAPEDGEDPSQVVKTLIETAERLALSGHLDVRLNRSVTLPMLGASFSYEVSWVGLDPLRVPGTLEIAGELVPSATLFAQDRIREVERIVNRVAPQSSAFLHLSARFPKRRGLDVYATVGLGWTQVTRRNLNLPLVRRLRSRRPSYVGWYIDSGR